ncbi:MAG: signal peptide peptidase SppA [Rikenellaceae bacterium]|jgi:protease-4|nr:signal peptide peptidase SppA [Rikenellaceae bacterium]
MKNKFFSTFVACLLAIVASGVVMTVLSIVMFAGMLASFSTTVSPVAAEANSILKIDLSQPIVDNPSSDAMGGFDPLTMTFTEPVGLLDVIHTIEKAATDDNIRGIYISADNAVGAGIATYEEFRAALKAFKENGKFIVSYADVYSHGSYWLGSVADHVYMNPQGDLSWHGMASQVMFYKGLFDKLGIETEIFRVGEFKSAVEPYLLDKMSPENRQQMDVLLGDVWGNIVGQIAESRGIDSALLQQYASELSVRDASTAVELDMIDGLKYNDEILAMLAEMSDRDEEPAFVSLEDYMDYPVKGTKKHLSKNKVQIVYAEGEIIDGEHEKGKIGGTALARELADLVDDDDVKAVVFRVNSPGGSALASELIWREVSRLREKKPVVVSMGNYAASGGYYISAPADMILADRGTLTGSIGVFGLMFNGEKALHDKLGITVDVVRTNPSADLPSPFRTMSAGERAYIQHSVEQVYETFVGHVADGRNLAKDEVLKIAGGRVWSGISADGIGLIDGFGGLKDAVALAAERAGVADDFRVVGPQGEADPLMIFVKMMGRRISALFGKETPMMMQEYEEMMGVLKQQGVRAAMPYRIEIE